MRFSRIVFLIAGIYGILVLAPGFFAEKRFGAQFPPAITHPEFYYGFFGVTLAWQVAFLIIAGDPSRFRAIIPAAILEKLGYTIATAALLAAGRLNPMLAASSMGDLLFAILFTICYARLGKPSARAATSQ